MKNDMQMTANTSPTQTRPDERWRTIPWPAPRPCGKEIASLAKRLASTFAEVCPASTEQWQILFSEGADPRREIRDWRWAEFTFKSLAGKKGTAAYRDDAFTLCRRWVACKDKEEVLETTLLTEITKTEAAEILDAFETIPAEFFGGHTAECQRGCRVYDFEALQPFARIKELVETAEAVAIVDWSTGCFLVPYGAERIRKLARSAETCELPLLRLAVDFLSVDFLRVEDLVLAVKGSFSVPWRNNNPR